MPGFLGKLKNIIRFAKITGAADNAAQFPVQQMEFKGKVVNALQLFPYGFYANVSADSLGVMFSIEGNESNRAAISYTPNLRPDDLEQDECAFYHPHTKTFIKIRNNGDLEIDSKAGDTPGSVIINCESATITANASVDITCEDATVTANNDATIDAAGNVIINGTQIQNNGSVAKVVTTLSINPQTGVFFPDGSDTLRAGDG